MAVLLKPVQLLSTTEAPDIIDKGLITGLVSDSISGEPLPYATIRLIPESDPSKLTGYNTDINGNFRIEKVSNGRYSIIVSYMGYTDKMLTVELTAKKIHLNISLSESRYLLDEVSVTAERSLIENTIKKTTINISKNNTLAAGTALDALQTAPSVVVDIDGNISYRGSDKVLILVNGAKSGLVNSLSQLPADAIEKIEIISNPSAANDAEGMSGIINIKLKSGQHEENNSSVTLNAGYPELLGGSAGYARSFDKLKFFINGGVNHKAIYQIKEHFRSNYELPDGTDYHQYDLLEDKRNNSFINTNLTYTINKKNKLGLSAAISNDANRADRNIDYTTYETAITPEYEYEKDIRQDIHNIGFNGGISYTKIFDKKDQQLNTIIHYSSFTQQKDINSLHLSALNTGFPGLQNTNNTQAVNEFDYSIEYIHPLSDSLFLETGFGSSNRYKSSDIFSESYDYNLTQWINDTDIINSFEYTEYINSLYFNFSGKLGRFDIEAGARAEYTITLQNETFRQSYLDLFPSITLLKKINGHNTIYSAYTRRINRPSIKMLTPFTMEYSDDMNQHKGNQFLQPEYVNSFEFGNRFSHNNISGTAALYYRHIDQAISRVKSAANDSAMFVTYINLDKAIMAGADFSLIFRPVNWANISIGANTFYTWLDGSTNNNNIEKSSFAWDGKITTQITPGNAYNIQLAAYYRSSLPLSLGIIKERYYVDLAINKRIMKKKGAITFKISDLFNTYSFAYKVDALDSDNYLYSQSNTKKIESRYFIVSFKYNMDMKQTNAKKADDMFFLDGFEKK